MEGRSPHAEIKNYIYLFWERGFARSALVSGTNVLENMSPGIMVHMDLRAGGSKKNRGRLDVAFSFFDIFENYCQRK